MSAPARPPLLIGPAGAPPRAPGLGAVPGWAPLACGLLAMYLPSFHDLFGGVWSTPAQAHGPIILALALWLMVRNWPAMLAASAGQGGLAAGWPLLMVSVGVYGVGRAQGIVLFEIASFISTLAALLLLMRGPRALRAQWFPLCFMLFMLPLPGSLIDMLTLPMQTAVSFVVDQLLHTAGYSMARSGVILQIGQYQLLVADACAGLRTLFTLEALGMLYLTVVRHDSMVRNLLLAILIVPISFTSNVIRVTALTLVTYHLGDAAGRGFLHGLAGMVLFVSALLLIMGTDTLLRAGVGGRATSRRVHGGVAPALNLGPAFSALARAVCAAVLILAALGATLAQRTQRTPAEPRAIDLETAVPRQFGPWTLDPDVRTVGGSGAQRENAQAYRQTLARTYVNASGERIMLVIAYGSSQTGSLRPHRQEVCYAAQGFLVSELHTAVVEIAGHAVPLTRMVASDGARVEPVTYWITLGDATARSSLERHIAQLKYALSDVIPDGYLYRVSSIDPDSARAFGTQAAFSTALMRAADPALRDKLLGGAG